MSIYSIFSLVNISILKSIKKCFIDCIYPTSNNSQTQNKKPKIHLSDMEIDSCDEIKPFLTPIPTPPPPPTTTFRVRRYRVKKPKLFNSIQWDDYVVL